MCSHGHAGSSPVSRTTKKALASASAFFVVNEVCLRHKKFGRSGTSIGANIREAQYAHGKADFIAKLQIALKEANETGYWLELLFRTQYIDEETYRSLDAACTSLRVMLVASVRTAKEKK